MTNADRIRAMSDEELGMLINACDNYQCSECPYCIGIHKCYRNSGVILDDGSVDNSDVIEWLKQEVEDEIN